MVTMTMVMMMAVEMVMVVVIPNTEALWVPDTVGGLHKTTLGCEYY